MIATTVPKITTLKNKQHSKMLLNSFPMDGGTLRCCPESKVRKHCITQGLTLAVEGCASVSGNIEILKQERTAKSFSSSKRERERKR